MSDSPVTFTETYFNAIVERRLDDVLGLYEKSNQMLVFDEGPGWSFVGYEQVAASWREFFGGRLVLRGCHWVEPPVSETAGELAWVAGTIGLELQVGDLVKRVKVRGTLVLRRADERWQIAHEHFSQPSDDPYQHGDWLPPVH
jgi:ketosteroid isomerase-like protein